MAFTHRVAHASRIRVCLHRAYLWQPGGIRCRLDVAADVYRFRDRICRTGRAASPAAGLKGLLDRCRTWLMARHRHRCDDFIAWWLAYRDMKLSGWLMLALEAAAVIGILALCVCIVFRVHPTVTDVTESFRPSLKFGGWTGLGYGMVYSILCFAGFEGAATLGEETINPRRNIPIALIGTVLFSGVFFMFVVAYCEIAGVRTVGRHPGSQPVNSQAPAQRSGALRYASTVPGHRSGPCRRHELLLGLAGLPGGEAGRVLLFASSAAPGYPVARHSPRCIRRTAHPRPQRSRRPRC